jgi:hypothetical protein
MSTNENPAGAGGAFEDRSLGLLNGSEDTPSSFRKQVRHLTVRFALPPPTARTVAFLAFGEGVR